jgi:two-component system sensor histidine kinase BaeS
MRVLIVLVLGGLAAALLITEAAMQPEPRDRLVLAGIYVLSGLATVGLFAWVRWMSLRTRRMSTALQLIALGAVAAVGVAVVLAAATMFLSDHDRNLVLVALALGLGLGTALAVVLGEAAGRDIRSLARLAGHVADGNFTATEPVQRNDEIGDLSESLHAMAQQLASTEEERRVLLASIGHDLRTPLAAMQAQIEAVIDGVVPADRSVMDSLQRDVAHLSRLVEDLFLFARMEAGTLALEPDRVDLTELADEAVEAMTPVAAKRSIDLRVTSTAPVEVVADPWALGRVLRNLLENAIRHSPPSSSVTVSVDNLGERSTIRVIDEGDGFPSGIREHAFDRFTRGDAARQTSNGGSGLGLAIARGIVEAHGGVIAIEDGPGGRVAFTL